MSLDSHILAMRTLFDPVAAAGLDATLELRLGEQRFHARVSDGELELDRGFTARADAAIETDPETLAALLWQGRELDEALRLQASIEGDMEIAERYLDLFPLPERAAEARPSFSRRAVGRGKRCASGLGAELLEPGQQCAQEN